MSILLYDKLKQGRIYLIAEMSANHAGRIENAYQIIEQAAAAGADCVKTQTYTADTLTIACDRPEYRIHGGLWDGYTFYQLYEEAMTPWEWQPLLKRKCEECGVDFLSTPFDFTAVDYLEKIGVEFYKVASPELIDVPLIEYIASKHKPMLISVGMGSEDEIQDAIDACDRQGNDRVILLKCCTEYPANYANMNLRGITLLEERFKKIVGLSDHSFGCLGAVAAVCLGARVIEKHVCISRNIKNPDSDFSMEMEEYKEMVKAVRDTEIILGNKTLELTEAEVNSRKGRRSLVASKDIAQGEPFSGQNVRSIRPAMGIKPKYYYELLGKCAKKQYEKGEPLAEDELN